MEQQKPCVFMPDTADKDKLSELHKAMGDFTRMKILWALMKQEYCVKELAAQMNMSGSAISHQLRILKQNKLVKNRREGKSIFYSLADDHVRTIINQGRELIEENLSDVNVW